MKAIIHTISPNGYAVDFEGGEVDNLAKFLDNLPKIEAQLAAAGYVANAEVTFPKLPDGTPICPKHREPMKLREKQGDTWYSHKVYDPDGLELYCRGHAGKNSPGWQY